MGEMRELSHAEYLEATREARDRLGEDVVADVVARAVAEHIRQGLPDWTLRAFTVDRVNERAASPLGLRAGTRTAP